jgi:phage shock protein A
MNVKDSLEEAQEHIVELQQNKVILSKMINELREKIEEMETNYNDKVDYLEQQLAQKDVFY